MSARNIVIAALLAGCFLSAPNAAFADFRFEFADEGGESLVVYAIRNGKVRMQPDSSERRFMLFDSATATMYMVDAENRRFTKLDKAAMDSVSSAMDQAMQQMQERMATMTPEQREAMKRFMPDMGKQVAAPDLRVDRSGDFTDIGGIRCEKVTVFQGGSVQSNLCIADRKALDMSAEDYDALSSMYAQMRDFAKQMPSKMAQQGFPDLGGVPISADDSGSGNRLMLRAHSNKDLPESDFSIPAEFEESSLGIPGS